MAFIDEASRLTWKSGELEQLALNRMVSTCVNDTNKEGLRAAELIGKLKKVDMFVRTGEVQVGLFAAIATAESDGELIELKPSEKDSTK